MKASSGNKKAEYVRLRKELKELQAQQAILEAQKAKIEGEVCLEQFLKPKRFKNALDLTLSSKPKEEQTKINIFFKPKNPQAFIKSILQEVLDSVWEVISGNSASKSSEILQGRLPGHINVKCIYSKELKTQVKTYLQDYSIHQTFIYLNRKVPRSTLYDWAKESKSKVRKGKQGRATPYLMLEEELFLWFIKCRARKLILSQTSLITKALKIAKNILTDETLSLSQEQKENYGSFSASNGWIDRFKSRYRIASRFITTRCTQTIEEMQISIKAYFEDLNKTIHTLNPLIIYNMDEVGIVFEPTSNHTLEVKGKKIVGKFSSGKEKERVTLIITAGSDGSLLPPFLIFKAPKPRTARFKDVPKNENVTFSDNETKENLRRSLTTLCQNYTAWNTKRVMEKFYIPYYSKFAHPSSFLIFDNHSSHVSDDTTKILDEKNIKFLPLAPNTTPLCQPVDVGIGCIIKGKIKNYFQQWLIDSWENDADFIQRHPKKENKYVFKIPHKSLIVKWVIQAYEETTPKTIIDSKFFLFLLFKFLGFYKSGVNDTVQQGEILSNKLKSLYISYNLEDFIHIEKECKISTTK